MNKEQRELGCTNPFNGAAPNDILHQHQPFVHLISSLTFGRFGFHTCSVSLCGQFSESLLSAWDKYRSLSEGRKKHAAEGEERLHYAFSSPGFGYSEETLVRMKAAGFNTGPAVAFIIQDTGPVSFKGYPDSTDLAKSPLLDIKEHFEGLGVSCFIAQGGHFPDDLNDNAIVFDVNRPDILTRLKPDFLSYFVPYHANQLSRPNHMGTDELVYGYCVSVMRRLQEYGKKIGATYDIEAFYSAENALAPFFVVPERADRQAAHHMQFVTQAFDAMLPALSPEERGTVVLQLASKLAGINDTPQTTLRTQPLCLRLRLN